MASLTSLRSPAHGLAAGPQAFLVELDAFVVGLAKNHGTHAAVAYRQRLVPAGSGLLIPEQMVGLEGMREQAGG